MKTSKIILTQSFFLLFPVLSVFSQKQLEFGSKKISVPGEEVCSYALNENNRYTRDYLNVDNGILLYTAVEFEGSKPVHIEITECKLSDLDKASCAVGLSNQNADYTPVEFYVLYLYTNKDEVKISTTIYAEPDGTATIRKSSVGRLHFRDEKLANSYLNTYIK